MAEILPATFIQSDFPIDTGIPIPAKTMRNGPGRHRFPWKEMRVDDSILIWDRGMINAARTSFSQYARRYGVTFTTRFSSEGYRIWRTS